LAERAIVFLVDARAARVPMIFDVGTRRGSDGIASRLCVNDADDARQNRLRKRGDEDPATNESRNATTHSVVSSGREHRAIYSGHAPGPNVALVEDSLVCCCILTREYAG